MKQREGPHDNEKVHRPNGYSFSDANVDQQALVGARMSHPLRGYPHPVRSGLSFDAQRGLFGIFFVASTNVLNNWRASWNTQRSAIRVSWFRDSASGL